VCEAENDGARHRWSFILGFCGGSSVTLKQVRFASRTCRPDVTRSDIRGNQQIVPGLRPGIAVQFLSWYETGGALSNGARHETV